MGYTKGRSKGKKNLEHKGKKIINQNGVAFTEKEKKMLESLVNSSNRKRKIMLENESKLHLFVGGHDTGKTIGETIGLMGKESDFIRAKKSKSLNRFKSKAEFKNYIKNLKRVNAPDYIEKRVELYKKSYIKAIRNVFGKDGKEIIKKIKGMTTNDYMQKVQSDETLEIGYQYEPKEYVGKLNQIKSALGIQ
jgi:predicted metal-dependent hydrolase